MDDHLMGYEAVFALWRHAGKSRFARQRPVRQPIAGDRRRGNMELLLMAEAGTVLQTVRKSPAQPAASRSMVGNPMV
jgi:hypothetical protein